MSEQQLPGHEFFELGKKAGESQKYDDAMMWYLKGAQAGNSWSMCNIGWLYSSGLGVPEDKISASEWYLKAAQHGDSLAMRNVADMYREGIGVTKDYTEALGWYRKGAALRDATCMFYLGWMSHNGWGIAQDHKEAMTWYLKSAEQGDYSAMRNMGVLHENGLGVAKDDVEAVRWYARAADLGDGLGMRYLGWAFQHGRGVDRDAAKAILWLKAAGQKGIAAAYLDLANLYREGNIVAADPTEARKWYRKAAKAGDPEAVKIVSTFPVANEESAAATDDEVLPAGAADATSDPSSLPPLQAQSEVSSLTEFELPDKVRELVTSIYDDLIAACRTHVNVANQSRDREKRLALEALTTTESRVAAGVARVAQLCNDAEAHLQRNRDLGGDTSATAPLTRRGHPSLDTALHGIEELESDVLQFLSENNLPLWPANGAARIGIVLGSIILAFQYWALLLTWPVIVAVTRLILGQRFTTRFKSCMTLANNIRGDLEAALPVGKEHYQRAMDIVEQNHTTRITAIGRWATAASHDLHERCESLWQQSAFAAAEWNSDGWQSWEPDSSPEFGARIGTFSIRADALNDIWPDVDFTFRLPALIPFGEERCLMLEAQSAARQSAAEALRSVVVRALANTPPGKARFTFVDPVGLGHNVADFMQLGDVDQGLIGGKSWSEPHHIEQQLTELTEHMETVIQKYLRKDFATIRQYNQAAQEVAEPFRFLVVFDFPVNFTESSARRLVSIVRNGTRCGVHTFILRDTAKALPYGFNLADLTQAATIVEWPDQKGSPVWRGKPLAEAKLATDSLDGHQDIVRRIMRESGESAARAMKVEVPFDKLLSLASLGSDAWWQKSSAKNLTAPLGPTGARKVQYMTLGQGLAHHVLVVGRTGSGKTNLMHVLITSLALTYSPSEIQLYLIDFKGGVGFKPYADRRLPHAAVIAIESEREFGMSVLQRLDDELRNRFELFRAAGVDNIASYRAARPESPPLPRVLLIIDEFQEFFTQDDAIAQQARVIFDRIVRQGRSFGLHLMLGTQSLSGAAELSTSTRGQMAVRIALPCSEADSRIILSDDNMAAKSLSRPGEGIYNAAAGAVEGNNPFQVALFSDRDLETYLQSVTSLAEVHKVTSHPIVFEGNEPASLSDCEPLLAKIRSHEWASATKSAVAWAGEPVAILPPVRAVFSRQAGRHLLIVSRDEAEGLGLLNAAWVGLLCQHHPSTSQFYVLDFASADTPWTGYAEEIKNAFGHDIQLLNRRTLPERLSALVATVNETLESQTAAEKSSYLLIHGLHRARDLRASDDGDYSRDSTGEPTPAEQLGLLLRDGPEAGVHVIAWCDTVSNAKRALDRGMREFGMRLGGAMSAGDSDSFLDCPDAAKLDKAHRVLFYDEEKPGALQKLRPYALPDLDWVKEVAASQRTWAD
jgi:TPR repeat protein